MSIKLAPMAFIAGTAISTAVTTTLWSKSIANDRTDRAQRQQECRDGAIDAGLGEKAEFYCLNPFRRPDVQPGEVPHQGNTGWFTSREANSTNLWFTALAGAAVFGAGALMTRSEGMRVAMMTGVGISTGVSAAALLSPAIATTRSGLGWESDGFPAGSKSWLVKQ